MIWGGASITTQLRSSGAGFDVALFAVGIVMVALAPAICLSARVRELEARLEGSGLPKSRPPAD